MQFLNNILANSPLEILTTREIYGNPFSNWIVAIAIILITYFALYFLKRILSKRIELLMGNRNLDFLEPLLVVIQNIKNLSLVIVGLYAGQAFLNLPAGPAGFFRSVLIITLMFQAGIIASRVVLKFLPRILTGKKDDPASLSALGLMTFIARIAVWTIIMLLILDNLNVNITALVTGLGIGGIAIALAVQNVLGDLLGSLSIVLDEPFEVGDFIIVDGFVGTVEKIGVKTTRVRSLSGEQLIFSNSDLLSSRIRNFKRMYERRVVFNIGVTYQTPYEKVREIPQMIRSIIEQQEQVRFDRSHFQKYGDFALIFEMVYYVLVPDYSIYMDIQQKINLALYRKFEEEGISFAYPTQTLYIQTATNSHNMPETVGQRSG